jgi:catechol-2,3-dioxygenase
MTQGLQINGVVIYVRDLDKSVRFYRELLGLESFDSSPTAALLGTAEGTYLVLRGTGSAASHPLGGIGLQWVVWSLPTKHDLDRCEQILRQQSAYRETRADANLTTIEGHDPDDLTVLLVYSDGSDAAMRELPARIYAW